jgi:hypothetical protein
MSELAHARDRALLARAHDGVAAALVACRPLVWDEDPAELYVIAYDALVVAGLVLLAVEAIAGLRRHWRLSGRGALYAALLMLLGVAAIRSPLPAQGWGLCSQLLADGGLAWYLLQVVPGRARLLCAALGGGLVAELALSGLQEVWVLPGLARLQTAGQLKLPPQIDPALIAERIQNGGVFGTFTQANALAGYLLLAVPPVLMALWRLGWPRRWLVFTLGAAAIAIAALTSSKASYLALAAALGLAFCLTRARPLARGALIAGALALAAVALSVAPVRHKVVRVFHDSAHVRLGYWAAGGAMISEHPLAGTGLSGYRDGAAALLPEWGQFSTHAHSEPIEAAAEAGLPAGLALLALLAWLPWSRREPGPSEAAEAARSGLLAPMAAGAAIFYLSVLGMMQNDNINMWPGGEQLLGALAWSLAVAALVAVAMGLLGRVPPPPPLACAIGLGALALHCLVDFDLHAGGVVGTAAVVAVLAGGSVWRVGAASPETEAEPTAPGRMRAASWAVAAVATAALASGVAWWGWFAARERAASAVVDYLQDALTHGMPTQEQAASLRQVAKDLGVEAEGNRGWLADLSDRISQLAWADYPLRRELLDMHGRGPELIEPTEQLALAWRDCAPLRRMWAEDERLAAEQAHGAAAQEHWHLALLHMREAVARSPWYLPTREAQVRMLTEASAALPDERIGLEAAAAAGEGEILRLRGVVDWTNLR